MGVHSVYCNFSKIAINDNDKCVLVPIIEDVKDGIGYTNFHLFTLPIYGTYNGYSQIVDIEQNENTALIENTFNCQIQDFCDCITGYDRGNNSFQNKLDNVSFCYVDRRVWDFMANNASYESFFENNYKGKSEIVIRELKLWDLFQYLGLKFACYEAVLEDFAQLPIVKQAYFKEIDNIHILNELVKIDSVVVNANAFSEYFKPFEECITPQGGLNKEHLEILNKFVGILKEKINENQVNYR